MGFSEIEIVGTEHYRRLSHAMEFYALEGFTPITVPWAVSQQAMDITRPLWVDSPTMSYTAGGQELCPVASAEQSFLQLQLEAKAHGKSIEGRFVAMTPCFRNEPKLDDLHQAYFMKVELCVFKDDVVVGPIISAAERFFERYLEIEVVPNTDLDSIAVLGSTFDIVSKVGQLELGSYGIREHPSVGRWGYGTGAAEPRLSYVLKNI